MPTAGERLAILEEQVRGVREDLAQLVAMIGDRRDPESVRGRMHKIEGTLAMLAWRRGVWRTWERAVLLACSVAVAVAAIVHLLN